MQQRMVVPNAVDILRDHLPKYASPYDEEVYLQKVADAMPEGTWFDSGSVLREHKNIQLYYRTDHHWSTEAAYYVYAAWAEEKGLSPGLHCLIIKEDAHRWILRHG